MQTFEEWKAENFHPSEELQLELKSLFVLDSVEELDRTLIAQYTEYVKRNNGVLADVVIAQD